MGTSYYLYKKDSICKHCGRSDKPVHIGKSSCGWCFTLHVIPEEGINTLEDWHFDDPNTIIKDEYDRIISSEEMIDIITNRSSLKSEKDKESYLSNYRSYEEYLQENSAVEGPNDLLRHRISFFCIGHGPGTYDYCIGEFC